MSARLSACRPLPALCCAILLALTSSATAQEATRARLLTVRDARILSDNFPVIALATGVSGRAVLSCAITPEGDSECTAEEETPEGMGFAAAAELIARDWRFSPRVENGQAVATNVRIPIDFQNETDLAAPIDPSIRVIATRGAALPTQPPADFQAPPSDDMIAISACRVQRGSVCDADPPATSQTDAWAWRYPAVAHQQERDGRALVSCAVRSDRRIDCAAERETPAGLGFGQAAVVVMQDALAHAANVEPATIVRSVVTFNTRAPGEPIQLEPEWERHQPVEGRFFPQRALERGQEGRVLLICTIQADRTVDCTALEETPSGFGFGATAVRIKEAMRVTEAAFGLPGLTVGDRRRQMVTFSISDR